jgi:hypothetical protein
MRKCAASRLMPRRRAPGVELPSRPLQGLDIRFRKREEVVRVRFEYRRTARRRTATHERRRIAVVAQPKHMTELMSDYVSSDIRQ